MAVYEEVKNRAKALDREFEVVSIINRDYINKLAEEYFMDRDYDGKTLHDKELACRMLNNAMYEMMQLHEYLPLDVSDIGCYAVKGIDIYNNIKVATMIGIPFAPCIGDARYVLLSENRQVIYIATNDADMDGFDIIAVTEDTLTDTKMHADDSEDFIKLSIDVMDMTVTRIEYME